MATYTSNDFFAMYPKFSALYGAAPQTPIVPVPIVVAFVTMAYSALDQGVWQGFWPIGMGYYIAHWVTLWLRTEGTPITSPAQAALEGMSVGVVASDAVGDVSESYDNTLGQIEGAGAFNLTAYGIQFYTLAQLVGAGGRQLNPSCFGDDGDMNFPFPMFGAFG